LLYGTGRGSRVSGANEHREKTVAFAAAPDNHPPLFFDHGGEQCIVAGQHPTHFAGVLLPKLGAAFQIGKEVGNNPGGQITEGRGASAAEVHPFGIVKTTACADHRLASEAVWILEDFIFGSRGGHTLARGWP
jgi:hypothetical protein